MSSCTMSGFRHVVACCVARLFVGRFFAGDKIRLAVVLVALVAANAPGQFVHPGMLVNSAELAFVKSKIKAGEEPWKSAWEKLRADPHTKLTWKARPIANVFRGPYNRPDIGASNLGNDAQAAYIHALEWIFTDNPQHAAKAVELINAWSGNLQSIRGSDQQLLAGIVGFKFCNAAELLKYTSDKWSPADEAQFRKMMLNVFYPLVKAYKPTAYGNWDAAMNLTLMCLGIFTDNREMYESAVKYAQTGKSNGTIPNYIFRSGQCQESGRDQAHTQLGLGFMADLCEVAWKQGDDLYGAFDNRVAAGYEYAAKYNLNLAVPYDAVPDFFGHHLNAKISEDKRGEFRPIYEIAYHHYHDRLGLEMKYTKLVLDRIRPEGFHWDHPSFGTLLYENVPPFPKGYRPPK